MNKKLINVLLPKIKRFNKQLEHILGDISKIKGSCDSRDFDNEFGYKISICGNSVEIKKNKSCCIIVGELTIMFKQRTCGVYGNEGCVSFKQHGLSFDRDDGKSFYWNDVFLN